MTNMMPNPSAATRVTVITAAVSTGGAISKERNRAIGVATLKVAMNVVGCCSTPQWPTRRRAQ